MATGYNYSITTDFGGNINRDQFYSEVKSETNITQTCTGLVMVDDTLTVNFDAGLTGGEKTSLDNLVSSHTPQTVIRYSYKNVLLEESVVSIKQSTYRKVMSYKYDGSDNELLQRIKISAYKDSNITNYSLRVIDVTNNNVIAEGTYTNDTEEDKDFTSLSNIPTSPAKIEIQAKKTGGSGNNNVYINFISLYFL